MSTSEEQLNFDKINNTVDIRTRETTIKLRLKTYGTLEQCQKSIDKVAYELRLQGLDVEVDDIYTAADDSPGVMGGMIKVREGDIYTSTKINIKVTDVVDDDGRVVARAGIDVGDDDIEILPFVIDAATGLHIPTNVFDEGVDRRTYDIHHFDETTKTWVKTKED